jgi:beta-glucanase (GH16 family)
MPERRQPRRSSWRTLGLERPQAGALVGFVAALVLVPAAHAAAAASSWRLTWHQEFNGTAQRPPDGHQWVYDTGRGSDFGNPEWEYYTDRPRNVSIDGHGHLAITARRERLTGMAHCPHGTCDITSGRITTKNHFAQAYGRFEARIKIPAGDGLWPAFWMLGSDIDRVKWPACGEIDVMEAIGRKPGTVFGTIHGPGYVGAGRGGSRTLSRGALADRFHVYGIEWAPSSIRWTLDGRTYFTVRRADLAPGQAWPFDHPFYLLLNLAVGGDWPGPPTARTRFPATMLVDWVRVYAASPA